MKNHKDVKIAQSELEVMRVLWDVGRPMTAMEIIQELNKTSPKNPKTVRTFLARLLKKNAIAAEKQIAAGYELLHYRPLVEEQAIVRNEREYFLSRFFGGTVQSMLASYIQSGDISRQELDELRSLIEEQYKDEEAKQDEV